MLIFLIAVGGEEGGRMGVLHRRLREKYGCFGLVDEKDRPDLEIGQRGTAERWGRRSSESAEIHKSQRQGRVDDVGNTYHVGLLPHLTRDGGVTCSVRGLEGKDPGVQLNGGDRWALGDVCLRQTGVLLSTANLSLRC